MANTYLTRTLATPTNRKKWTLSMWVKRSNISSASTSYLLSANSSQAYIYFNNNDTFNIEEYSGGYQYRLATNRVFRDTSAWYHLVISFDSTNATADDRVRIYINGVQETLFSARTNPSLNFDGAINNNNAHFIGREGASYWSGLISHIHFIDGTAYDATAFGQYDANGVWTIKDNISVSYGTNGFWILKDGNSVTDQSGNSNNFTVGGGTLTKTEDTPSNVFATWNPLAKHSDVNLHNGNTRAVFSNYGVWKFVYSTLGASSGKYYYEVKAANTGSDSSIGIMEMDTATNEQGTSDNVGKNTESVGYASNGSIKKNNVDVQTGVGSISTGNILGIAMDLDNNTVQFYLQGVAKGTAVSIASDKTYAFATSGYTDAEHHTNFGNGYFETTAVSSAGTNASGNGIFEYDVPTGFTALSTKGLNL
jgi:hypothetical protein